jgi:hypothetical protein
MTRKIALAIIFLVCLQSKLLAAAGDSVRISIPPYTDTTCFGSQLRFIETDTFPTATVQWYINNMPVGVTLDTFYTTAPNDGDSVYCRIFLPSGDSATSNAIVVHRALSIPARALVSLMVGANPDCEGYPLTFEVYPVNGGTNPRYQWMINRMPITGSDSTTFTRYFGGADTVTCRMVSNSECAPEDTVFSIPVPIIHINLTADINIIATSTNICKGQSTTFTALARDYGRADAVSFQWYINGLPALGALTATYITDSLDSADRVTCVMTTTDSCVLNPVDTSNELFIVVNHLQRTSAYVNLINGSNPGCIDSAVTFKAIFDSFGFAPYYEWRINGVLANTYSDTISRIFAPNDVVSFTIWAADGGCYIHDTINVPGVIMIRDTAPPAPLVSLIGNLLVANDGSGSYRWFYNSVNSEVGATLIPGANGVTHRPGILGYYFAMNDSSYCPSPRSNIIYISLLRVDEVGSSGVKLYPNPSKGTLNFDWGKTTSSMVFELYTTDGRGLMHTDITNTSTHTIDLSYLPSGNYFVVLRNENGSSTRMITLDK